MSFDYRYNNRERIKGNLTIGLIILIIALLIKATKYLLNT